LTGNGPKLSEKSAGEKEKSAISVDAASAQRPESNPRPNDPGDHATRKKDGQSTLLDSRKLCVVDGLSKVRADGAVGREGENGPAGEGTEAGDDLQSTVGSIPDDTNLQVDALGGVGLYHGGGKKGEISVPSLVRS